MDEVIVVGGGIAGCATAYYLARDGAAVTLVEQAGLSGLASSANAGSLHAQIPHDPFRNLGPQWASNYAQAIPFYMASLEIWRTLEEELGTDLEIGFGGGLLVGASEAEMAQIAAKAAVERSAGLPMELLDTRSLREHAPYLSEDLIGGALCPIEGKANPMLVAPAFAHAAQAAGARIVRYAGPATITREAGAYTVATAGGRFTSDRIVIAAGWASGALTEALGVTLGVQAFPIQVSVTEPAAPLIKHLVYSAGEKLTMKQTRAGSILIGGGWSARLDGEGRPIVDVDNLALNLSLARAAVPAIGGLKLVRSWAAFVNGTDDWLPILGELPGAPGVFLNYVPWMGFTGGPAAARAIASMVQGKPPPMEAPFDAFSPRAG
ncbi:FAD-binding oxidoreductase [Sphingomonas sp.]|uniref:NAD(P)/FAD-dependent oxidoreductase n=1 Tax=Sphingomonas sp. TaxID=28214 RepID=UPI00262DA147|nr:FAD-binding oxidoreductase [Sphingomonas sp.]